jgi:transposase
MQIGNHCASDSSEDPMKRFRPCSLDQPFLVPPSLQDWLPEGHLARFIAQLVTTLNLSEIIAEYGRRDARGQSAYHPEMMVRLLLYGYAVGVRSSRAIEKATYEDLAFRYLAADQHPDHSSIAEFRSVHLDKLSRLFVEALELCQRAGLVKLGQVAIDGTKVAANASRHQSRNYKRLQEKEAALAAEVKRLLAEAEQVDREEDQAYGKGQRGDELPADLATAQQQLDKIRAAKQELEQEAKHRAEQAAREQAEQNGKAKDGAQRMRWSRAKAGVPAEGRKGNLTDPESALMIDGASKAFVQGYNAQVVVAGVPQIIVAQTVVSEPTDKQQLQPMMELVEQTTGQVPELTTADAGYWNESSIVEQQSKGRDLLIPPDRGPDRITGKLPAHAPQGPAAQQMRARLQAAASQDLYRKRCGMVEPVFGMIKDILGYRRFLMRGLRKVKGEWAMICTAFNLIKLFRYGGNPGPKAAQIV